MCKNRRCLGEVKGEFDDLTHGGLERRDSPINLATV
jgi:hypothetical protein